MALYHGPNNAPLARELPKAGAEIMEGLKAAEQYQKAAAPHARRAKRGLSNLVGKGADEFDQKPAEDEDLAWLR